MAISTSTSLDYLIDDLRVHLGDVTAPYRYSDELLRHALVMACKTLGRKWRDRYTINSSYVVSRSATATFTEDSPPVIMRADERLFILQAAIILVSASLKDAAWDLGSWRDDEVAYSNIAGGNMVAKVLSNDIEELERLLRQRLYGADRQELPGFRLPMNYREGYR